MVCSCLYLADMCESAVPRTIFYTVKSISHNKIDYLVIKYRISLPCKGLGDFSRVRLAGKLPCIDSICYFKITSTAVGDGKLPLILPANGQTLTCHIHCLDVDKYLIQTPVKRPRQLTLRNSSTLYYNFYDRSILNLTGQGIRQ